MSERYAVFFCPDDASDLAKFGYRVLGRTADGHNIALSNDDFPDRHLAASLSAIPAHYGFHATLKAPFRLSGDSTKAALLDAVERLACSQSSIVMHSLQVKMLSGFQALVFDPQPPSVANLAEQCVEQLEIFRAPLTDEDLRKRNPLHLSEIQRGYLGKYGYPYVMSEFRFHMTLTGPLHLTEHADYTHWLHELYRRLVPQTPVLDRLVVFWQPDRSTAFKRLAQFPLC